MWTTVHVAVGRDKALEIKKELTKIGFLVKVKIFSREGEDELYEIIAPEIEARDIQEAMLELEIN